MILSRQAIASLVHYFFESPLLCHLGFVIVNQFGNSQLSTADRVQRINEKSELVKGVIRCFRQFAVLIIIVFLMPFRFFDGEYN